MASGTNARDQYQKFFSKFILLGSTFQRPLNPEPQSTNGFVPVKCYSVMGNQVESSVQWMSFGLQLKKHGVRLEGWSEKVAHERYIPGRPTFKIRNFKVADYRYLLRGWELLNGKGEEANEAEKEALERPETISRLRVRPWTDSA